MDLAEQQLLLEAWRRYSRDRDLSNATLVEFYFDVVTALPFARHGLAFEVFDLIINGVFELQADAWRHADPARGGEADDETHPSNAA
jgi:hypothetical protein